MRHGNKVETRLDRRALAQDAGMGRLSLVSVLAGALCGCAAFEVLAVIAGAVGVAVNGSTDFADIGAGEFKAITAVVVAGALFVGFAFGGYVSGRMSRRHGATHGLATGIAGAILAAVVVAAVRAGGADNGVARVARHIQVADTWHQWRSFALFGAVVVAAAMVFGALMGGVEGERWHGKLLARAADPSIGPEADERAKARRLMKESEAAHRAAEQHLDHLAAMRRAATDPETAEAAAPVTAGSRN